MKWIIVVVGITVSGNGNVSFLQEKNPVFYETESSCLDAVKQDSKKPLDLPLMTEPMKWRGFCLKIPDIKPKEKPHKTSKPGEDSI